MRAIEVCRTAVLGGHRDQCDHCGHLEIFYNSYRNRHCPKCQTLRKEKWIEARVEVLLPIEYFHVVFTIPSELNPLFLMNRNVLHDLLFRSASETLAELAKDPKHLGATVGVIGILQTWGQNLVDHPHHPLHCHRGGLSSNSDALHKLRRYDSIAIGGAAALFFMLNRSGYLVICSPAISVIIGPGMTR